MRYAIDFLTPLAIAACMFGAVFVVDYVQRRRWLKRDQDQREKLKRKLDEWRIDK